MSRTLSLSTSLRNRISEMIFPLPFVGSSGTAWYSGKSISTSYTDLSYCYVITTLVLQPIRIWIYKDMNLEPWDHSYFIINFQKTSELWLFWYALHGMTLLSAVQWIFDSWEIYSCATQLKFQNYSSLLYLFVLVFFFFIYFMIMDTCMILKMLWVLYNFLHSIISSCLSCLVPFCYRPS